MRILPIITAIIMAALIYLFVFQRDLIWSSADAEAEISEAPQSDSAESAIPSDEEQLVRVVVQASSAQPLASQVLVRGETEAARQVNLVAETSGAVISQPLRKGTFVTQGQAMCELDPGTRDTALAEAQARLAEARAGVPAAQASVQEAKARLEEAKINQNAASKLKEGGFASQTRLASAEASLEAAQAGVRAAESGIESASAAIQSAEAGVAGASKEIERLIIRASFDGILESDTAELGSLLQPGALCATVIQLDPIKLVGFVTEVDVSRIDLGAMAKARLLNGQEVAGKVSFISRSGDPTTRTFRTEIEIPNPDLNIRDGQSAEIAIEAEGTAAHLVPGSALTLNSDGQLGLRIVSSDNIVAFNQVTVLRDTIDGMWLGGLPDQANIIVVGQEFVEAGVKVDPTFREASQ